MALFHKKQKADEAKKDPPKEALREAPKEETKEEKTGEKIEEKKEEPQGVQNETKDSQDAAKVAQDAPAGSQEAPKGTGKEGKKSSEPSKASKKRRRKGGTGKIVFLTVVVFLAMIVGLFYLFTRIRKSKGAWGNPFESTQYIEEGKSAALTPTPTPGPTLEPEQAMFQKDPVSEATTEAPTQEPTEPTTVAQDLPKATVRYYDEPAIAQVAQEGVLIYENIDSPTRSSNKTLRNGEELMVLGDARAPDATVWYLVENWEGTGYIRKDRKSILIEGQEEEVPEEELEEEEAVEEAPSAQEDGSPGEGEATEPEEITIGEEPWTEVIVPPDEEASEDEVIEIG